MFFVSLDAFVTHIYHKLGPRATPAIFLGHAANHFGYRCLDLNTNKIIISCHVSFDETVFPFQSNQSKPTSSYDFLEDSSTLISTIINTTPIGPNLNPTITPPVTIPASPTPATPPPSPPNDHVPVPTPPLSPPNDHVSVPTPPPIVSTHPMVTRSHVGTTRPNAKYTGHVSTVSPSPRSYEDAFNDPNWRNAIYDEYNALVKNKTWKRVPRPKGVNVVSCMLLFRHKYLADGTLSRYKARLVANGSKQIEGVDVDDIR